MELNKNILVLFFFSSFLVFSQKGPGGVGYLGATGEMYLWLRPDPSELTIIANKVSSWQDQSGYLHNGIDTFSLEQSNTNAQPIFGANQMNGIDVVTFDGVDDFLNFDITDFDDDEYDLFFVWKRNEGVEGQSALFSSASSNSLLGGFQLSHVSASSSQFRLLAQGEGSKNLTGATDRTAENNILEVMREVVDPGSPTILSDDTHNWVSFINSNRRVPTTRTGTYSNNTAAKTFANLILGSNRSGVNHLGIDVAEVVFFKKKLNTAERIIVTNYLSSKYDIRLRVGTTNIIPDLYDEDDVLNGDFDHDVVGIGQAEDGSNNPNAVGTGILGLSMPSSLSNNDYLFVGHNNKSLNIDEEVNVPAGIPNRISRVWRASKTNDLGTVTVTVNLGFSTNKGRFTASNLKLIVNNTIDFNSPSVTQYGSPNLTYNSSTGIAVFTGVTIADNDYITIGSANLPTIYFGDSGSAGGATGDDLGVSGYEGPGGIGAVDGSSMYLWLRPDEGKGLTTNPGKTRVNSWQDQSGYKHNGVNSYGLEAPSNGARPKYGVRQMNGYQLATFDGVNDYLYFDIDTLNDSSYEMYFIWKNNENSTGLNKAMFSNAFGNDVGSFQITETTSADNFFIRTKEEGDKNIGSIMRTRSNNFLGIQRKASNNLSVTYNGNTPVFKASFGSVNPNLVMSTFDVFKFGTNRGTDVFLGMDLAEVFMFNKKMNTTQRLILENYVSAKYDISIPAVQDKYRFDRVDGFDHHLAGIGCKTVTNFHKDAKGTGPVRIKNPSDIDPGEYLLWATDKSNSNFDVEAPSVLNNFSHRLFAKWRVAKTGGDVGAVDVVFTVSDLNFSKEIMTNCANYTLLIDDTVDFSSPTQQIPMSLSGGEIKGTGINFNDGDYFTLQLSNTIVYDGVSWLHPTRTGTAAVPNKDDACLDLVVLNGSVSVDNNIIVNTINVADGAVLTINTEKEVTVYNRINLNTDGKLKLLGTAQLLQDPLGVFTTNINSGTGFYNEFTTLAKDVYSYSYISPSASTDGLVYSFKNNFKDGRGVNALSKNDDGIDFVFGTDNNGSQGAHTTTISKNWIHTFENAINNFVLKNDTGTIDVGLGVLVKEPGLIAQTYISKGVPNSGRYKFSALQNSVILLGNPYPSALDANAFLSDNNRVDALYFYEDQATSLSHYQKYYDAGYAVYTQFGGGVAATTTAFDDPSSAFSGVLVPKRYIPVGQSFFASVIKGANTTVTLSNTQRAIVRLGENSKFFKQKNTKIANENKETLASVRLGFETSLGDGRKYHRQIGVNFKEGNLLDSLNIGYDAVLFDENPKDIYIASTENKFVLAGVGAISEDLEVPLTVVLDQAQEVSFMLDNIQNINQLYLKDHVENTTASLKGTVIKKRLAAGIYSDRFSLTFKQKETLSTKENKLNTTDFTIKVEKDVIRVTSDNYDVIALKALDFTGKKIQESKTNTLSVLGLKSKLILLKIESKQGVLVKKIWF